MSGLAAMWPPWPYVVLLGFSAAITAVLLVAVRPPVTRASVLAFSPWALVGAALHVPYVGGSYPALVAPLFGPVAVTATTFVIAGMVWTGATVQALVTDNPASSYRTFGVIGVMLAVSLAAYVLFTSEIAEPIRLLWTVAAVVGAELIAAIVYVLLRFQALDTAAATGVLSGFVVFGQTLPAVVTAVRVDVFGVTTSRPLVRLVFDLAMQLPVSATIGVGWSLVVVRLLTAVVAVVLLARYVERAEARGYLLLGLVAVAGLGPGCYGLFQLLLGI